MSLDVWLEGEPETVECICACCDNAHTRVRRDELYSSNITHNLGQMASEAGIYKHLWRPDEIGITKADQLIEPLTDGLSRLKADPERFEKLNSPNGWGRYENFVPFVEQYLEACKAHPQANVRVWR